MSILAPEKIEEALLGAFIMQPGLIKQSEGLLEPEDFGIVRNGAIFDAMTILSEAHQTFDLTSLAQKLQDIGSLEEFGGTAYLRRVANSCPDPSQWVAYASMVREASNKRMGDAIAEKLKASIREGDLIEALNNHQSDLDSLRIRTTGTQIRSFASVAKVQLARFTDAKANPSAVQGLRCNLPRLDDAIGGFRPKRLYVIYAATNAGKSTLLSTLASTFIDQAPGLVVPTESSAEDWLDKLVAAITCIPFDLIETGQVNEEQASRIMRAYDYLAARNCHFLDAGSPTPQDIRTAVVRGKRDFDYGWVIVDSATKLSFPGATDIYNTSKGVADALQNQPRELNIPYIVSAQVKPGVAERSGIKKIPRSEDGYGGAVLAHNADVVLSMYTHWDYQELDPDGVKPDTKLPKGATLVRVTKHRWRKARTTGSVLRFIGGASYVKHDNQDVFEGSTQTPVAQTETEDIPF